MLQKNKFCYNEVTLFQFLRKFAGADPGGGPGARAPLDPRF